MSYTMTVVHRAYRAMPPARATRDAHDGPDFGPFVKGLSLLLGEARARRVQQQFEYLATFDNVHDEGLLFYRHTRTGRYMAFDEWGRAYEFVPSRHTFVRASLQELVAEIPELVA